MSVGLQMRSDGLTPGSIERDRHRDGSAGLARCSGGGILTRAPARVKSPTVPPCSFTSRHRTGGLDLGVRGRFVVTEVLREQSRNLAGGIVVGVSIGPSLTR